MQVILQNRQGYLNFNNTMKANSDELMNYKMFTIKLYLCYLNVLINNTNNTEDHAVRNQ